MFRFDKLTQKAQEAVQQSQAVAEKSDSQILYPLHLLVALAREREGVVRPVLEKCGVHPDAIALEGERMLKGIPKVSGGTMQPGGMYVSQPLNQVLEKAFEEAGRFKDEFVSTEHLLLAIADQKGDPAGQLLERAGHLPDLLVERHLGDERVGAPVE
jgi:ATP-dependent Clp protease ATP-binding subunit ClpB